MRHANGSHCHATIAPIDARGAWANQAIGGAPTTLASHAKNPVTGCIRRFFQISAATGGITKNGEMTSSRTSPRPATGRLHAGWFCQG